METKKHEKVDLERKRPLFFGIGLVISLSFVIAAFEWKSEIEPAICCFETEEEFWPDMEIMPYTEHTIPEPPKPKPEKKPVPVAQTKEALIATSEEITIDQEFDQEGEVPWVYVPEALPVEVVDDPFEIVEKMPEYPGGEKALYAFLGTNIKYPRIAKQRGIEGRVTVHFVIERDGSVSSAEILKGIGFGCDEEAIRVIQLLKFSPGKQRGIPVRVQMNVPINFRLK